jgi:hypothetical protein
VLPRRTPGYTLCIYDGAANAVLRAAAWAGGLCRGRPCWRETASGFKYVQPDLLPNGLFTLDLRAGIDGRARITIKGKSVPLHMPTLPLTLPVTVQLTSSDGTCCGATYLSDVQANQPDRFKGRSE